MAVSAHVWPDEPNRAEENELVARTLEEVAELLEEYDENPFRPLAYRKAADTVRTLRQPLAPLVAEGGVEALDDLPTIGPALARHIQEIVTTGGLALLDRLRARKDPIKLLATVPGVGIGTAKRIHETLGIDTLEDLEAAASDGRLEALEGMGEKRIAGIRDALATRLQRVRLGSRTPSPGDRSVDIGELLDVDREYREKAEAGTLRTIAPRRFNPTGEEWLPVLRTRRGRRRYTALYSNTARAHELGRVRDWVVLYYSDGYGQRQATVVTATQGPLKGKRVVRGREAETEGWYAQSEGLRLSI